MDRFQMIVQVGYRFAGGVGDVPAAMGHDLAALLSDTRNPPKYVTKVAGVSFPAKL
jgi:hypothetical protein